MSEQTDLETLERMAERPCPPTAERDERYADIMLAAVAELRSLRQKVAHLKAEVTSLESAYALCRASAVILSEGRRRRLSRDEQAGHLLPRRMDSVIRPLTNTAPGSTTERREGADMRLIETDNMIGTERDLRHIGSTEGECAKEKEWRREEHRRPLQLFDRARRLHQSLACRRALACSGERSQ